MYPVQNVTHLSVGHEGRMRAPGGRREDMAFLLANQLISVWRRALIRPSATFSHSPRKGRMGEGSTPDGPHVRAPVTCRGDDRSKCRLAIFLAVFAWLFASIPALAVQPDEILKDATLEARA